MCQIHFEDRGCWKDPKATEDVSLRPLSNYLMNERDPKHPNYRGISIDWANWGNGYLNQMICRCAHAAQEKGFKYFGIQNYGISAVIYTLPFFY